MHDPAGHLMVDVATVLGVDEAEANDHARSFLLCCGRCCLLCDSETYTSKQKILRKNKENVKDTAVRWYRAWCRCAAEMNVIAI